MHLDSCSSPAAVTSDSGPGSGSGSEFELRLAQPFFVSVGSSARQPRTVPDCYASILATPGLLALIAGVGSQTVAPHHPIGSS